MKHPSPHCTTHEQVQAFEAHARALSAKVGSEVVFSQHDMGDGRIRHTAKHVGFPDDVAHDYLPASATEHEIEKVQRQLAARWTYHALRSIDTPEAKANRAKVVQAHRKEQERLKREEQAKKAAAAREKLRKPVIAGPSHEELVAAGTTTFGDGQSNATDIGTSPP